MRHPALVLIGWRGHRATLAATLGLLALPMTLAGQGPGASPQVEEVTAADYVPVGAGNRWLYRNHVGDGPPAIDVRVAAETLAGGARAVQIEENNIVVRSERVAPQLGLLVDRLTLRDGTSLDFDPSLTLWPARLRLGTCHKQEGRYVRHRGGLAGTAGLANVEACPERIEDVETPVGTFSRTLRLRTILTLAEPDGARIVHEQVDWLVTGVGAVKFSNRTIWTVPDGTRQRLTRVDAVLEAASVGGRAWTVPADAAADSPAQARTRQLAMQAFSHFRDGLATGDWTAFLALMADDFTFWFPMGKFLGEHKGKATAATFFGYVSSVYPEGLFVTLDRVTVDRDRAVFEFRSEGTMVLGGERRPYKNRVTVAMDFRDGRLAGYREYFGSDQRSY